LGYFHEVFVVMMSFVVLIIKFLRYGKYKTLSIYGYIEEQDEAELSIFSGAEVIALESRYRYIGQS